MSMINRTVATNYNIPQDGASYKAFSICTPVFGPLFSWIIRTELDEELKKETEPNRLVKLLEVKNDYLACEAMQALILTVVLVARVASRTMPVTQSLILFAAVLIGYMAAQTYQISCNNNRVRELQTTGYQPGMAVC